MGKGYYLLQAFYYSEDIGPDELFVKESVYYHDDNEKDAVLPLIGRLLEMTFTGVKWTDISIKRWDLSKATPK